MRPFAAGKTVRDVVLALEISYAFAQTMRQDQCELGPSLGTIARNVVDRLAARDTNHQHREWRSALVKD